MLYHKLTIKTHDSEIIQIIKNFIEEQNFDVFMEETTKGKTFKAEVLNEQCNLFNLSPNQNLQSNIPTEDVY